MTGFSETERYILNEFKDSTGMVKQVLEKFCQIKADDFRRTCAQDMSHVPRDIEHAADAAAKAEVFETFMQELMSA